MKNTECVGTPAGAVTAKADRVLSFVWQHVLLLVSLFVMTLGVALTIRSGLGSSVISSIPMDMTLAGEAGMAPALTIGDYTNLMNILLVVLQILILRRKFEKFQLFQLIIGTVFGWLLDLNMWLTSGINPTDFIGGAAAQLAGCVVLGVGIAFEIRCGSITMPGEGITVAVSRVCATPFAKTKIVVDTTLVLIAVMLGYIFFGRWLFNVIGVGTLFAMVFVGLVVRFVDRRIGWFTRLLHAVPGFRRTLYGLARFLPRRRS